MTTRRKRMLFVASLAILMLGTGLLLWRTLQPSNEFKAKADPASASGHAAVAMQQSVPTTTPAAEYDSGPLAEIRAQNLREVTGKAIIALEGAEARAKYKDPFEFIAAGWHSGLPYKEAHEWVDPASLPQLRAALKDPRQASSWPRIAQIIGYIAEDAQSARDLLDYVRAPEDWKSLTPSDHFQRTIGKVKALLWVGKIGDDDSVAILKKTLTEEGANELAKNWIGSPLPTWAKQEGKLIELIRGTAAIGLVHSQNLDGIRLVEQEYERLHAERIKGKPVSEYYNQLVTAMAIRDLISDIRKQEYLNLLGSEREVNAMSPYLRKYDWFWQQREKTTK